MKKNLIFIVTIAFSLVLISCGNTKNGHEYVDLGLPSGTLWATCNVGANSPEDYGDYFAWGETTPDRNYTIHDRPDFEKVPATHDAATVIWGDNWRLPLKDDFKELISCCSWTWVVQNGKNGYKVTGTNGNSLFLPAGGYNEGTGRGIENIGKQGFYWTSERWKNGRGRSTFLFFDKNHKNIDGDNGAALVRPVYK
ncbi:MAG: hypothetical protein J6W06_05825 [Bacteroidales bacterium]|nr:hypothetical protein [Bacteroidales bacterium]